MEAPETVYLRSWDARKLAKGKEAGGAVYTSELKYVRSDLYDQLCAEWERLRNFQATAERINALPERLRAYIHDLEARSDLSGEVRELSIARDTCHALGKENHELRAEVDRIAAEVLAEAVAEVENEARCPRCGISKEAIREKDEAVGLLIGLLIGLLVDEPATPRAPQSGEGEVS